MRRVIEYHKGRVVNTPGDALLAEFASVIGAVSAAVEIQQNLESRNMELAPERRMHFRIGVNLGDVIEREDGTIYGDGVNIAARIEALAEAGGTCVSSTVYDAVDGKVALGFDFLGEQQVKNIARPVRVYRVRTGRRAQSVPAKGVQWRGWLWPALGAVVVLGGLGIAVWLYRDSARETAEDPILAMPNGPSIAVLPFTNLGGDPAQDYFSDGLTEQLITALARYSGLYVIARNSTFQYKGRSVDVREIGRELGARYVLEGSVRRSGTTLRVTAQLLDARSGAHLWAETYDRALTGTDIFALQDDITSKAVASVAGPHGRIAQTELKQTKGRAPDSLDSYDCVLRAVAYSRVLSPEGHGPIRDCLERAVARDPDYGEGWAWLAFAYLLEYESGLNPRPELYDARDRALEASLRAATLDPNSAVVHSILSYVRFLRHEIDASLASGERALALNPTDPEVLCNVGQFTGFAGNWERGIALTRKAMSLSQNYPTWCHFQLSAYHYLRGEYEQALAEALKIDMPDYFWTHIHVAMSYGQLGRTEEARAAIARLLELYPDIAQKFPSEQRKYNWENVWIEHQIEGLRKAGLEIPQR
jgi:adenylate cyclase